MNLLSNFLFYFLVLGSLACSTPEPAPTDDNNDTNTGDTGSNQDDLTNTDYNILFVGNSLTSTNNLPELVKEAAADKNLTIGITSLTRNNYAIVDHWNEGAVQDLIKTKLYDYVVIQQGPSSQELGKQILIESGKDYKDLCEANNAQLCFFMVWPSLSYYDTFDGVIANYTEAANTNNATLLPVGLIWKMHFDATDTYDYYGPDGFHPSALGSEVAADVIVNELF